MISREGGGGKGSWVESFSLGGSGGEGEAGFVVGKGMVEEGEGVYFFFFCFFVYSAWYERKEAD